jgi:group II intron reverse transcriptase/maturase
VLEAVYEQDFLDCSYGFRPGRGAHDAVRTLSRVVHQGKVSWILEADVLSFFDSMDRTMLKKMLGVRVADGSLLRLIGKCLHVGVLEGVELSISDSGTAQGSALSPLLGNIYLHYALDRWFERDVKPELKGQATLVRYADDFVFTFEYEDDAQRVMDVLGPRLERFGLSLHPDKTRLLPFREPPGTQQRGKGRATFDFLGFTFYWKRTRQGRWRMFNKTRSASLRRFTRSVYDWCRRHRHLPVKAQHTALTRRLQGHFNYFGVNGNLLCLQLVLRQVERAWYKWLCRRSQKRRLTWERFADLLRDFPLPKPRIVVSIWGS